MDRWNVGSIRDSIDKSFIPVDWVHHTVFFFITFPFIKLRFRGRFTRNYSHQHFFYTDYHNSAINYLNYIVYIYIYLYYTRLSHYYCLFYCVCVGILYYSWYKWRMPTNAICTVERELYTLGKVYDVSFTWVIIYRVIIFHNVTIFSEVFIKLDFCYFLFQSLWKSVL